VASRAGGTDPNTLYAAMSGVDKAISFTLRYGERDAEGYTAVHKPRREG
jgi:hypothetical protein